MSEPKTSAPGKIRRSLLWMVFVSLGLQVAAIGVVHQYRFQAGDDHFAFG